MIRIKDIADIAGVSPTTVSNVLHGNTGKVSPATIVKIEKLIKEMQYIPNMAARQLAKNNSKLIAVVAFGFHKRSGLKGALDPFVGEVLQAFEHTIRYNGYFMIYFSSVESVQEIVELANSWNIAGMVVIAITKELKKALSEKAHIPFVALDSYLEEPDLINIGTDDFLGGYKMGNLLSDFGHKNVLFLSDNDLGVDHCRWLGLKKYYCEIGMELPESSHIIIDKEIDKRKKQLKQLIPQFEKHTALFFASDYYAAEAMNFFKDCGLCIPQDVSIAGFDDNMFAEFARPRLTTVRQDNRQKCRSAIECLLKLIDGDEIADKDLKLPVETIIRDSVRNIRYT